jgi:tetratricopeptide (TPR) repeat protein
MLLNRVSVFILFPLLVFVPPAVASETVKTDEEIGGIQSVGGERYTGSVGCRKCHERFYELWAPSHHGLAMQPYTSELGRNRLTAQEEDIGVGEHRYRMVITDATGWVLEKGPNGERSYRVEYALGGKNVYYFLTSLERGRLQTLPVAYDVRRREWFDTAASGVRHFPDMPDEPVHWTHYGYTFNTSCFSCHVSQLSSNYDLGTDTYRTAWMESGINCETCHGGGTEHVEVCQSAAEGELPDDLKIIRTRDFTVEQTNSMCAPCHAKMRPLTTSFQPGDRYYDHFDLTTLEHPDFYPDGRDLGENYTYTLWRMSPCIQSGKLDCLHCHTSSGRYRFKGKDTNDACMPCHEEWVSNAAAHSHHAGDSEGSKCVSCHMPMTEFARMRRSDHSMLPPAPAATIAFESPNACNLCHTDRDAEWADRHVREWRDRDYQAAVLHRAGLIAAARKGDWKRLPGMLEYIGGEDREEVFATSLIRLLQACDDERKWPAILKSLEDSSPLVRSAAATTLAANLTPEVVEALLRATRDEYRLVRVQAALSLAPCPREWVKPEDREGLDRALGEYLAAQMSRPDHWASHYNLGNYHSTRGESELALEAYRVSLKLDPERIEPRVNASMVHARRGETGEAEKLLREALRIAPANAEANFNLGLLLAEMGETGEAQELLRRALKSDPALAAAAYNLGILLAQDQITEAISWCRKAFELRPRDAKYAYTLAFYLNQSGDQDGASGVLEEILLQQPASPDVYSLLAALYQQQGKLDRLRSVYERAASNPNLPSPVREYFAGALRELRIQGIR